MTYLMFASESKAVISPWTIKTAARMAVRTSPIIRLNKALFAAAP
jgi:hypothetical protein